MLPASSQWALPRSPCARGALPRSPVHHAFMHLSPAWLPFLQLTGHFRQGRGFPGLPTLAPPSPGYGLSSAWSLVVRAHVAGAWSLQTPQGQEQGPGHSRHYLLSPMNQWGVC